jgi:hypothetical protein
VSLVSGGGMTTLLTSCTCREHGDCAHCAAVWIDAACELQERRKAAPAAAGLIAGLTPASLQWLDRLQKSRRRRAPRSGTRVHSDIRVYHLLVPGEKSAFGLLPRLGQARPNGTIILLPGIPALNPLRPGGEHEPDQAVIASLIHSLARGLRIPAGRPLPLAGVLARRILDLALAGGCLCHTEKHRPGNASAPLVRGEPRHALVAWESTAEGRLRPLVAIEPAARVVPCQPPLFFDEANNSMGPLQSDFPLELLEDWAAGPAVDATQIVRIGECLAGLGLPRPPLLDQIKRVKARPPQPLLRVREVGPEDGYIAVSGPPRFIAALPLFRYASHGEFAPLDDDEPEDHLLHKAGAETLLTRNRTFEQEKLAALAEAGLGPLAAAIDPARLGPRLAHARFPAPGSPAGPEAWLEFNAGGGKDRIQAAGWELAVEPGADFECLQIDRSIPAGLRAKLRLYQLGGFRWMQFLARHQLHGILADDMGLGKTIQTLAHLLAEKDCGRKTIQRRPAVAGRRAHQRGP